jgi:hypothetical protein
MRGLRSFIGLLVVALALGAYLYFVESKRTPGDDAEKRDKVFTVAADAIEEVTIKSEAGDRTTLKKTGTEWQVTAPAQAPADAAEVSGITTNLSTVEIQRLVEENAADLKMFGLAEPRVEVAFKSGGQEQRLLIGNKTPTGSDFYAKTAAQPKVFLIASFLDSTFNRSAFDLRDKTALAFDREKADALEIVTGERTLRFSKTADGWTITQPPMKRPDAAAIEGLVSRISGLQMKQLIAPEASDLKSYGLAAPAATVRVGSGPAQATLLLGSPAGEGVVHARDASRPEVFTLDSSLLEDLKKDAGEYVQKDLFEARAFNTTRIEILRGGETRVFEKTSTPSTDGKPATEVKTEEKWRQTAPSAKDLETPAVIALLSALVTSRADSIVSTMPSGAKPEASVTLTFDEGKQERVTFYRAGDEVYASRDGVLAKLQATVLDGILKALPQ